jgi:hypothetical protein
MSGKGVAIKLDEESLTTKKVPEVNGGTVVNEVLPTQPTGPVQFHDTTTVTPVRQIKRRRMSSTNDIMTPPEKVIPSQCTKNFYTLDFSSSKSIDLSEKVLERAMSILLPEIASFSKGSASEVQHIVKEFFDIFGLASVAPSIFSSMVLIDCKILDVRNVFVAALYIVSAYTCSYIIHIDDLFRFLMPDKLHIEGEYVEITNYVRIILEMLLFRVTKQQLQSFTRTGEVLYNNCACLVTKGYNNKNEAPVVFKRLDHKTFALGAGYIDTNMPPGRIVEVPYVISIEALVYRKLAPLKHRNICQLLSLQITTRSTYMVFPLYEIQPKEVQPEHIVEAFRGVCEGVKAIHSVGIAPRDIKMENVRYTKANTEGTAPTAKIIDFNSASILNPAVSKDINITTIMARAPEVLAENIRLQSVSFDVDTTCDEFVVDAFKSDIWSLGCYLHCLASKDSAYPFQGLEEHVIFENITRIVSSQHVSEQVQNTLGPKGMDLFWKCCCLDPLERPTAEEIMTHEYFN